MSIAVSALTTSQVARNSPDVRRDKSGAVQLDPECSGQSATAQSSVRL
jgi:hypothetical protein